MTDVDTARALDDPGLANERTALAWSRSAVALAVVAALLGRAAARGANSHWAWAAALVVAAGAAALWWRGTRVYAENRRALTAGTSLARPRTLRALTALSLLAGLAAIAVTLFGR